MADPALPERQHDRVALRVLPGLADELDRGTVRRRGQGHASRQAFDGDALTPAAIQRLARDDDHPPSVLARCRARYRVRSVNAIR